MRNNTSFSHHKPYPTEILGDCDNDYCTGCEPGCGLETVRLEGPAEPPDIGPEEITISYMLREMYSRLELSLFAIKDKP